MRYRKKPVVIEARLATEPEEIHTLEGVMRANVGDYIITGVMGEVYPCKPDIFEATYEPVGDDEPAPDPHDMMQKYGLWRCPECGEAAESGDPAEGRWRWAGNRWQHHHGCPVGHVDARYFGAEDELPPTPALDPHENSVKPATEKGGE